MPSLESNQLAIQPDVSDILHFWFSEAQSIQGICDRRSALWWGKNEQTDRDIRRKFIHRVEAASTGKLDAWQNEPESCLAFIILIDQFRRNIYRGKPEAFSADSRALAACLNGIDCGLDKKLSTIQRVFFYLPLEHSEDLAIQDESLRQFGQLEVDDTGENPKIFAGFNDYARSHFDIIKRFHRYPHRNAILKRESTEEEIEFLQQAGSSF